MPEIGTITTHESGGYHVFEWRIQDFSTLRKKDGARYRSPDFSFGGERWYLRIYTNGRSEYNSSGHVDLRLVKYGSGRSIRLSFSLSLKTAKGERHREEHVTKDFDNKDWGHTLNRFISREELTTLRSDLLRDDVLTVVCIMKGKSSAGSESHSASAEICTPVSDSARCSSDSGECRHCSGNFAAGILSPHQRKCEQRPVKCPDCQEVVVLQKFLNEHECQPESPEGATSTAECPHCKLTLEAASLPTHERSCIDRPMKCPQCGEDVATKLWLEHKCFTARTNDYNFREKILMALCIASIIIAVVTGCVLAHSKTPLSPLHPGREAVTKIETSEIKIIITGSEMDGSGSNAIGDTVIKQSEGVNKAAESTLTAELDAELNKADQSEIVGSDNPVASVANQADTDESKGTSKIQTSGNNRSDVVESNEYEASDSNETSSTDIKEDGNINKTLAAEMNETDKSDIAASDIPEASTTNQADTAVKDKSEPLPQPVLMVTEIGSTYLEVVWILPEESKSNSAHLHYILLYRKYGGQWQVVSFPDGSGTSYSLTNLDPGTSYQIYIMAVDSSGFSKRSEIETVRTSNKVIDDNSPKDHEKQFVLYAAAIITLVIAIACVYHYSKTFLSATNAYGEETQTISAGDENVIIADRPEVAETDESEESESKKGVAETEGPVSFKSLPEDYGIGTDINHLLKDNRGIDVTFELETASGKTKIFAHQLILALMSPHFADEFYDKGRNKGHRVIPLKGIDPKAFEQMIRYCYGETPTLKTTEEACVLFKIASEFKVMSLQNLCCNFFRYTNINPGNVFCILEISEEMEDNSLKNMCHKILQNKTREVMTSYELCDVTPAMVRILLDMPSLSLESEYELIKWIFDWGREKSEDKDSCCRSTRDYLEDLLQNMNFLALTVEEFAILSRNYPKVFTSDERASISLNIACPGSWNMPVWYNKNLKCRVYTGSNE